MLKNIKYYISLILASFILAYFFLYLPSNTDDHGVADMSYVFVNNSHTDPKMLFIKAWRLTKTKYVDSTLNNQDWYKWKKRYLAQIKTDEDAWVAINSMLASLNDPYSKFLGENEYQNQTISIDAKLTGIGINMLATDGKAIVVNVIEDTPAAKAQLKPGDLISEIDGTDVKGMDIDDIVSRIRGPINTEVTLVIFRNKEKLTKTMLRDVIRFKNVKSKIIDNEIAYIQINSFLSGNLDSEFIEALKETENTKAIILDLRGNMGGLLPNAIYIANIFINKGNLVSMVDRKGAKSVISAQTKNFEFNKPLVVLVDSTSASASEILGGALKDHKRAIIVGETTFGKGLVQKIYPLPNKTGMNLTVAKYLTPNDTDINKIGIAPDVPVELTKEDYLNGNDSQLQKAIQIAKKI